MRAYELQILGIEVNGNTKKTVIASGVGLLAAGLGYVVTQATKVEPLISKVDGVEKTQQERAKIQDERSKNQDAWNSMFIESFKRIDTKQDEILKELRNK